MTKSELIEKLAQKLRHLSHMEVEIIVDTVFNQMKDALRQHHRIELRGFGIFEVRHRKARQGRNPKSGSTVQVQNRSVPFFKVGKELKDRVNNPGSSIAHNTSSTLNAIGQQAAKVAVGA